MQQIIVKDKRYSFAHLPAEPTLLIKLIDLCCDDAVQFEQLAEIVEKETALAAKIVQLSNSPAYRQWNRMTDLRRMLVVLGLDNVKNIILATAVQQFFSGFDNLPERPVQFIWFRSLVCASLAQRLAQLVGYEQPREAYLAGLLHQIGQLLLLQNHQETYGTLLCRYYEADDFRDLEREQFGIDHCTLGGALVESWQLDSFVADAIRYQLAATSELHNVPQLLKIIGVAAPLSTPKDSRRSQLDIERAGTLFALTESSVHECLIQALEKTHRTVTELGYDADDFTEQNYLLPLGEQQAGEIRQAFSERIKNLTLASCLRQSDDSGLDALAKSLRLSFELLFGVTRLLLVVADELGTNLSVVNDLRQPRLDQISFSCLDEKSLLVKAVNEHKVLDTFFASASICDKQLLRHLQTDGARIVPLPDEGQHQGAVVLGLSAAQAADLHRSTGLIQLLLKEAAHHYRQLRGRQEQHPALSHEQLKKIIHEVSNPLTIIKNYLYVLGKKVGETHQVQEELDFINEEIERVGNILLRAKDPNQTQYQDGQFDLNALVRDLDKVLQESLYKSTQTGSRLLLDEKLPALHCCADKVKQILINLLKNAAEALEQGGRIEISTRGSIYQQGSEFVELTIRDNGPGIPAHILKELFTPVESTKAGHSGVGLSIVGSLISEIGGSITCHSTPERGTEFKLFLPLSRK